MADMTGILSHICSTGENGKSLGKRAKNAPSLKKVDVWFFYPFIPCKERHRTMLVLAEGDCIVKISK